MTAAIRTEGLCKVYRVGFWMRKVVGLKGLDLEVRQGEVFGFIGPNGAGKTTTIKTLVGLHAATAGKAWIGGLPHDSPKCRDKLGFLPERPYFYSHLSGREVLHFFGQLHGLAGPERSRRVEALLERVQLGRFADVALGKYSKGMLQRIGLCQALINDPDLLILDEPMSGLDPVGRALVRDVILEERAQGKTVFFSSHILPDVEALADRISVLIGGELLKVGTIDEVLGSNVERVECLFEGPVDLELPGERVRSEGGSHLVRIGPDEVDSVLQQARERGARVVRVSPMRTSLEDLLVEEIERRQAKTSLGVLN